ncbi:thioredoxin family protein [Amycolatopsis pigmentata]|uniref:Thioredoxin family protein n=1 Tax=Amycolatopsis pigmentata TaxID=450801 RepID=A0ABW5FZR0_9PSEU
MILSTEQFAEVIAEHDFLIINFGARWCGPCRVFNRVFTDAAGENFDVAFAVVDVEEQPELGAAFAVRSVPTIAVLCAGALVFSHEGSLSDEALEDVLRQVRALDIKAVRQAAAAQR